MHAQLQARPTPALYFPDEFGTELVPPASQYDAGGLFTLGVFAGRKYVWVGAGEEACTNDGDPVTSNEPFTADTNELLLGGPAETAVLASVKEVLR